MRAGVSDFKQAANYYSTAAPGGLAGSSLMTFFVVFTLKRYPNSGTNCLFSRTLGGVGYYIQLGGTLVATATNSTPGAVVTPAILTTTLAFNRPYIFIVRYNGVPNPGNIEGWLAGVSTGTTTLGTGYTPDAAAQTTIGGYWVGQQPAVETIIHECGMLDTYDVVASYNTSFGVGGAGLNAQWSEDLQQGRYLTCPNNGGVWGASSEYWSARDAIVGPATKATWLDRSTNAFSAARTGAMQGSSVRMVF